MQNRPPTAGRAGLNIFQSVIEINNFLAAPSGQFFQCIINPGVGFHRADFVRKNITVKITEEREIPLDVFDGKVIGV